MRHIQTLVNNKQFKEALETAEREIYCAAFKYAKENQTATARLLEKARGTVINKLRLYSII